MLQKLFDPAQNPLGEHFLTYFRGLKPDFITKIGLGVHLEADGLRKCKTHAYELIRLYKATNVDFDHSLLFTKDEELRNFNRWIESRSVSSTKTENYKIISESNLDFSFSFKKQNKQLIQQISEDEKKKLNSIMAIGLERYNQIIKEDANRGDSKFENWVEIEVFHIQNSVCFVKRYPQKSLINNAKFTIQNCSNINGRWDSNNSEHNGFIHCEVKRDSQDRIRFNTILEADFYSDSSTSTIDSDLNEIKDSRIIGDVIKKQEECTVIIACFLVGNKYDLTLLKSELLNGLNQL